MRVKIFILILVMILTIKVGADDVNSLKAEGDRFWAQRDSQLYLLKAIDAYTRALTMVPNDKTLLIRLSTAYYWKGTNFEEEKKEERKKAFTTGQMYAQKLCEIDPDSAGGNFWYTVNMALYGGEVGVMKSAFMLPEIKKRMGKVMSSEKFYHHGGPQRLLARIDYETPSILRGSLEAAEVMLKEAIQHSPNFTLSHIYLADIYMEMKKPTQAREELEFVLTLPEDALPGFEPEIRRDKKIAKVRMRTYFAEN